ncbi:hypothetical protein FA13DRAFT_173676 [Coprinellus micaceus]|uniref:Uncharacterized protein n=1 Tax=Coprinellus micaceus TaxID=71717 RepID=A0A4Y7SI65_COPMI|nr:hypothetical protein FA13DRAFT_173676 [Coprinellus micaceus]
MGLDLAMDSDSDDDSDEEEVHEHRRKADQAEQNTARSSPEPSKGGGVGNSRIATLAVAIHSRTHHPRPTRLCRLHPPPSPKPIAAPKSGYAAPTVATLGVKSPALSEGENPFEPQQQQQQQGRSPFDKPPQ